MDIMDSPYEIGNALEVYAASVLNADRVPQSGAGKFLKLDVKDKGRFVFSCKATRTIRDAALRAIIKLWREAVVGSRGFAGHGDGAKPAMIFSIDGEVLVLARLTDYAELVTGASEPFIPAGKAQTRRDHTRRSLIG